MRSLDNPINRVLQPRLAHRRDERVICPNCARQVERKARQQKFCSSRCKEKARQRTRKAGLSQGTGAPTNPPKNINKINGFQPAKSWSSTGISAPRAVLQAELIDGRAWHATVSTGGVSSYVAQLGKPTLVNGRAR